MRGWLILGCLCFVILLIPVPLQMKDGGTVHYDAILYDVYDVHRIRPIDDPSLEGVYETEFIEGTIIKVLGIEVFNNTDLYAGK